jgi:hypothetical protein
MKVVLLGVEGRLREDLASGLLAAGHHVCTGGPSARLAGASTVLVTAGALPDRRELRTVGHLLAVVEAPVIPSPAAGVEEAALAATGAGWSLQRSTILHQTLDGWFAEAARRPLTIVPRGVRHQPVDASELVRRVVALVRAGPAGCVPALAGPQIRSLPELAAAWARARGRRLHLVEAPWPDGPAWRGDGQTFPERAAPGITWEDHVGGGSPRGTAERGGTSWGLH